MPLRLAIFCNNYLYGEGLKELLKDESEIEVVGIFNGGSNLPLTIKEIIKLNPDLILANFNPDFNIFLGLPEDFLKGNQAKIVLVGDRTLQFIVDKQFKKLLQRGVVGILSPSADSDLLKKALKAVFQGELWLDRKTMMKILSSMREAEKDSYLGRREKEIISHICQGYRNKEIAQRLNISEQTVKSHCNRIYKKLGVSDRLQLALYSYRIWPDNAKV